MECGTKRKKKQLGTIFYIKLWWEKKKVVLKEQINDLENTKKFFVKYLGAKSNDGYCESCIVAVEDNQIEITV